MLLNRSKELAWLRENWTRLQLEIPEQWVVLEGETLTAHGPDYPTVYWEARGKGVPVPFVEKITLLHPTILAGL